MSRPAGLPPLPASDANYPAGSDPWSGTPTKVDPGLATIAAGFVPNQRLPAQILNFLENAFGTWIRYQDRIEVLNFQNMGVEFLSAGDELHIRDANNHILYNEGLSRYFVAGRLATDDAVPKVFVSNSGSANSWEDTAAPVRTPGLPTQTYQIQNDSAGRLLGWITESDLSYFYVRSAVGVWGSASVNQPTWRAFVGRSYQSKWVLGGVASGVPKVYVTDQSDTWTAQTLTGAAATEAIVDMAHGNGHIVALGSSGNVWSAANLGDTWAQNAVGSFGSKPTSVVFVNPEGLFWLLCEGGHVYTSSDGNSWTLAVNLVPGFPGVIDLGWGGAAAVGGVVVAAAIKSTPTGDLGVMAVGWNSGANWDFVVPPMNTPLAMDQSPFQFATHLEGDSRIAIGSKNGSSSNGFRLVYSLRT